MIHETFLKKSGCEKMSLTYFTDLKPWYVRKGTDDTCLCRSCEDFRLAKKAVTYQSNVLERPYRLLNILRRSLYAFFITLQLKKKVEAEGGTMLLGTRRAVLIFMRAICLPLLSIGELCHNRSGSAIVRRLVCSSALPDNDHRGSPTCYGECAKNQLCQECYNIKGEFKRLYRNPEFESSDRVNGWKSDDLVTYTSYSDKKGADTSQMSLLYQHHVHPTVFVEYFNKISVDYAKHLSKLIRQKHCQKEQERNLLPHMLIVDIDFSQNFVYTDRKSAIQSDHWTSTSVTLFICVVRYLCMSAWLRPPLGLLKGQAVSIRQATDDGGGDIFVYGEVNENQQTDSSTISIKLASSRITVEIPCESVRVRNIISVPLIVVSDSKKHDTHFVRYFLRHILLGPTGWLSTQTREVGLCERIRRIDIDSDGAAAHFKQRGSIHFITSLSMLYTLKVTWTFGCAGHGKGTWDGLGGIVKNKTGHYIKAFDTFISSAYEVYEIIEHLFAGEEAQARYDKMVNLKIKSWTIIWLSDNDIVRPVVVRKPRGKKKNVVEDGAEKGNTNAENAEAEDGETIGALQAFHSVGTRGLFYFHAEHRDGLGVRLSGCHCPFCVRFYRKDGIGTMPTGCLSKEPYEYVICQRSDEEWVNQTSMLISNLVTVLKGEVRSDDIVAVVSNYPQRGLNDTFHVAKVVTVDDTGCVISVFERKHNTQMYQVRTPENIIHIPFTRLRYIISVACIDDSCITLESVTLDNVVKNCFNGML
jgi:hypothetical protein